MKQDDLQYFEWAMILARNAHKEGYSPVGAIAVSDQGTVFPASSKREIGNIYHAEYISLVMAQEYPGPLSPMTLYSTLEPCIMCSGMAAVMKFDRIAWLVDDVWAGASRVYNPYNSYIKERFPIMDKVDIPDLHKDAQEMWVEYLVSTGHADAVQFMLGLSEDYQCK